MIIAYQLEKIKAILYILYCIFIFIAIHHFSITFYIMLLNIIYQYYDIQYITISSLLFSFILIISSLNGDIILLHRFNYFSLIQERHSMFLYNPNSFNCYNGAIARKKYCGMFSERRRNAYTN